MEKKRLSSPEQSTLLDQHPLLSSWVPPVGKKKEDITNPLLKEDLAGLGDSSNLATGSWLLVLLCMVYSLVESRVAENSMLQQA